MEENEALPLLNRFHETLGAFYAGGDPEPVRELLCDEVEWHVPGASPIAGDYYGVEAVLAYFTSRRSLANATLRMHPQEVLVGNDHIAVITDGTATIRGTARSWTTVGLYRIKDGGVAACWLLPLDAEEFDSVWSAGG